MRSSAKGLGRWAAPVLAMALMCAAMPLAQADPIGCADINNNLVKTLADYQQLTGGCVIENVLFNFSTSAGAFFNPSGVLAGLPASDVQLSVIDDGVGEAVGFKFQPVADGPQWTTQDSGFGDINVQFVASIQEPGVNFSSTTLSATASLQQDPGFQSVVSASETVYPNPGLATLGSAFFFFGNTGTDQTQNQTAAINPQTNNISANKDLFFSAGAPGDSATLNSFADTFTYTPEPSAALLAGIGLLLVVGLRRWRRRVAPLACLAIAAVAASSAHADTCTTTTLDQYISQGGCTIGDVLFKIDSYTAAGGAPADTFNVTPITSTLFPGLDFALVMQNNSTTAMSVTLVITVSASQNPIDQVGTGITGGGSCFNHTCATISGGVTPYNGSPGGINIPYGTTGTPPSGTGMFSFTGGSQNTNPNPLPLSTSMQLSDVVTLTGGGNALSGAHMSDLKLQISQTQGASIPEPATFLAIGGALVVLATGTRRFQRSRAGRPRIR